MHSNLSTDIWELIIILVQNHRPDGAKMTNRPVVRAVARISLLLLPLAAALVALSSALNFARIETQWRPATLRAFIAFYLGCK